ncbi:MAG: hypothetical protein A2Y10_14030 [Planctomycetes bacterium GWF2_41_51]|nr:MAG: hypothetical protein A2Y10_14030 [Planctomycetes bacterium GWF2_41_51]
MTKKIKWGIVGTGGIAHTFAKALAILPDAELVAVSSRKKESAEKFAAEFNIPNTYIGADSLARDKNIDIAYISSIHPAHKSDTLNCLNGGKAVLCEKPFAMNGLQAAQMIDCAAKNKLFLMEAMWTYFFPAIAEIRQIISNGDIGEVRLVNANFCFNKEDDPLGRLINPILGGGTLLDIGVYVIAFTQMIYGKEPEKISSLAHICSAGTDEQCSMIFAYNNGAMASLNCSFRVESPCQAAVYGTKGYIKVPHMFFQPDKFLIKIGDQPEKEHSFQRLGNGYTYQAVEVMRCLREGKLQSDIMPWDTSRAFMNTMDKIRQQWNLIYPCEK